MTSPSPRRAFRTPMVRRPLDRRTLLRGTGAALALPLLESMAPPLRSAAKTPRRYVALFCPNGMWPKAWRPETTGADYALTPTLEPIAPHRDRVLVLGNLFNRKSRKGEGHYVKTTAWLSGAHVKRTGGRELQVGTSIDQVLAAHHGHLTPIPSLVLGIEPVRNRVDMGYSTVYGANISWRTPTVPAERELKPQRVFERLTRWSDVRGGARERRAVLDLVRGEARALRGKLGSTDRAKLDEYLESVGALERRIASFSKRASEGATRAAAIAADGGPTGDPTTYPEHVDLMLEMLVLALRTDATRVGTLMFGNAVSGQNFSFLEGVEGGHHGLSHHEKKADKQAQYARINRWHVEQFASFLGRLRETDGEADALLDSTIVQFGSGLADGNRHDPNDLPLLVAGPLVAGTRGGGRHVRQAKLTPLCNLYERVLVEFGHEGVRFGDSTEPLAGI